MPSKSPSKQNSQPRPIKREAEPVSVDIEHSTKSNEAPEDYTPEGVLEYCSRTAHKTLEEALETLELEPRRRVIWRRDLTKMRSSGDTRTIIAFCGGTGVGKSSTLNAILDANIVPTSGIQACTSVVTEIAYHTKPTIDADVSFLSRDEWKAELEILLSDLVEDNGSLKPTTDLKSDAGVAWLKVHAVYPTIDTSQLILMTPDQIISSNIEIEGILGSSREISTPNYKKFRHEINKYIDANDHRRGKDTPKKKRKDKRKKDRVTEMEGATAREDPEKGDQEPKPNDVVEEQSDPVALWPLIRGVKVRTSSPVLATGAVLVDLPGTEDANAARSSIARQYLKKADCVWILSPIHRAVDSKVARDLLGEAFRTQLKMDGGYNADTITFVATKCDDIASSEVIKALQLRNEPELRGIEDRLKDIKMQLTQAERAQKIADNRLADLSQQLEKSRAASHEYQARLRALQSGQVFETTKLPSLVKKRKNTGGEKPGPPKRRRNMSDDDESSGSDSYTSDDDLPSSNAEGEDTADEDETDELMEDISEESLEAAIQEAEHNISLVTTNLNEVSRNRMETVRLISSLSEQDRDAQRTKDAYCAKKRSEHSTNTLKDDFRTGCREYEDAAAEELDPDNFDPSVSESAYATVDLPVFCVSARDYTRLTGQVRGDGKAVCFTDVEDTGIPSLQKWVTALTRSPRETAAQSCSSQLRALAEDMRSFLHDSSRVTSTDRNTFRAKWKSQVFDEDEVEFSEDDNSSDNEIPGIDHPIVTVLDERQLRSGITPRLVKQFSRIVEESVTALKHHFRNGLEERCRVGAANAADTSGATLNNFRQSMHHRSYSATIRRDGEFHRDLNVELVNPLTRYIAQAWQGVFEADVFAPFFKDISDCISALILDIEESAPSGLKQHVRTQGEICRQSARVSLNQTLASVKATLTDEQKTVSRSIAPFVKGRMLAAYAAAKQEKGKGSVMRATKVLQDFIHQSKDIVFNNSADSILEQLDDCASSVGATLRSAMTSLARKVELNISVIWETQANYDSKQAVIRSNIVIQLDEILGQLRLTDEARQGEKVQKEAQMEMD
ncbi:hypothetical protein MIND_00773100 [Mycena indigotica]|uniref:Nuclear GTPase SLIP-GC n=1 Tax=Mycena indigotica TaxID=2126181 RepID=A0A8H6W7G1_9AGAR|nr:uncharacterized protein MIND_00773100 [Mycena indigotica]KAF7302064.1 hypothetical protein MIND_00773100 [Mycena indigotica]